MDWDWLEAIPYVGKLIRWGRLKMRPPLTFGCPVQAAKESNLSWWHVPVRYEPRWFNSWKELRDARVFVRILTGGGAPHEIRLHWQRRGAREGAADMTLQEATPYLVPVVIREEGKDHNAYLTDSDFLISHGTTRIWPLVPMARGKHKLQITVRSGKKEYHSSIYIVRNHPFDSNGHFVLEKEYEGSGLEAFSNGTRQAS